MWINDKCYYVLIFLNIGEVLYLYNFIKIYVENVIFLYVVIIEWFIWVC